MKNEETIHALDTLVEAYGVAIRALRAQYSPAKLDRSRWEVCGTCSGKYRYAYVYDVRYCPNCGRPLTEEAWAEMERRVSDG